MAISLANPVGLINGSTQVSPAYAGMLATNFSGNHIFSMVNDQATAIDFGRFVARSTSKTCKANTSATDVLIGITQRTFKASTLVSGDVFYNQLDTVPVVDNAPDGIWCVAAENVNDGDLAVSIVASNGAVGGRNTAASTSVVAAKAGGNTGNGTLVKDATTPLLTGYQDGIYTITCTTAGANAATFRVTDPAGRVLGDVSFSGSGASATFSNQIKFAVTDGATDFIVGDGFTFTVNAGRITASGSVSSGRIRAVWLDTTTAGSLGRVEIQQL